MTVLANFVATFSKGTNPPLKAFVRISEVGDDPSIAPQSLHKRYEVSFDSELRFADNSEIDGASFIMFSELVKPSKLDIPNHVYIPYPHSIASFTRED